VSRIANLLTIAITTAGSLLVPAVFALGAEGASNREKASADGAATYKLRYKLNANESIHYEVTHVAKTKTRIRGAEEVSQVHTISKRHWDVLSPTPSGDMVFDHVVDSVEMTQQQGDKDEIKWNSETDSEAPREFRAISDQIGQKLSTLTINAIGKEIAREDDQGTKASLGMGSLTLSLPEEPIAIGGTWSVPREVKARTEGDEVKPIKIRELYTLDKVSTGVATILVKSETLTPIDDESVRAQVVQQLSNGHIRFDIDNGRMLSKQLDWDETVVGFQGPNSLMEYRVQRTAKKQ
jgi:hypothetical protein